MIQKLKESSEKVIGFKLTGRLTDDGYESFIARVEAILANNGKIIRLLMFVDHPQNFNLKASWKYLIFWIKHIKDIERLAIVGQKEHEKWLELLEKPFIRTEVKYFKSENIKDVWDWIKSPD